MKLRVTRIQIAERAGVSVATVDRVINRRAPVRGLTVSRVQSAAEAMGSKHVGSIDSHYATLPIRCGFLLQRRDSVAYQQIASDLEQVVRDELPLTAQLTIEFVNDYLDPSKVAEK